MRPARRLALALNPLIPKMPAVFIREDAFVSPRFDGVDIRNLSMVLAAEPNRNFRVVGDMVVFSPDGFAARKRTSAGGGAPNKPTRQGQSHSRILPLCRCPVSLHLPVPSRSPVESTVIESAS